MSNSNQKHYQHQAKPAEQEKPVLKLVDPSAYERYVSLKFIEISGAKLTPEVQKELIELEAELKKCSGKKPVRTVNAAIDNEIVKLVEGIPVPEFIETLIKEKGCSAYYFGNE